MLDFDVEKTVQYWAEGAEYDMGVADAMLQTGKHPYALFMGHLALEKLLKALVVKTTQKHAPFTHSLTLLAEKSGVQIPDEIILMLAEFMEFHFESRYPEEQKNFYLKCTKEFTAGKIQKVKEVFTWLKKKL
ncbi:MAG: HEPN domain-containing protein [Nitrospinae bacterium]|nr:HEPN domain-containing protein [Nitrospinota bacterium]